MSETAVRAARPGDAAAIAAVHVASWQAAYRGLLSDELLDGLSVAQRTEEWGQRMADNETTVAELDGRVVGLCEIVRERGEDPYLKALYLDPHTIGRGVGRRLLGEALARLAAEGERRIGLDVVDGNARAHAFYERMGFRETGERSPWNGAEQLRMAREL